MIYVLRGNTIRDIGLPLQLLTVEETGETITDYYPSSSDTIEVNMVSSCSSESMEVTVEDNYLHWAWVPTITGTYGIEVKITQADGTKMRSYRKQQVRVYNSNDQLPEDDGEVEFVSEYLVLDTTTILFVKGETGDTGPTGNGIESIEKTSTSGLVDYYTITYTDGTTSSFTVTNGQNADISAANAATLAANTAASAANEAASLANEKANLANEAATSAANAADNATSAAYTANTYAAAANSAAGSANAAAIDANNATTAATTATEAANTATTNANNAATAANTAASSANSAASDASSAATSANTAATSANSAASTANTAAEAATTAAAYNNELNISAIYPTGGTDSGNTYTLANAIAKVPSAMRNAGVKVTFISDGTDAGLSNGNAYTYEYQGPSWEFRYFERIDATKIVEVSSLGLDMGVCTSDLFEIGNIAITTNGWTYSNSTTRVRLKQGLTMHLYVGDVISLSDYTDARFFVGWLLDGQYYTKGWNTSDYTLTSEGDYVILLCNLTDTTQSSKFNLYSLLHIDSAKKNENLTSKSIQHDNSVDYLQKVVFNERFFAAGTASMLDEKYFHVGSLQGSGYGSPAPSVTNCCYTDPIPYKSGTIAISATAAAQELICGIRIQVRNDIDFSSTTGWKMLYSGYTWTNSIILPTGYKYVTFGFCTTNSALWDYSKMSGITITTTSDWSGIQGNVGDRLDDAETEIIQMKPTVLRAESSNISSISEITLTNNYYLNVNNGQPVNVSNTSAISDFIPLMKGDSLTFTLSQSSTAGLACIYDENKSFVQSLAAGQGWGTYVSGSYTATEDLEYVRFSCVNASSYLANYVVKIKRTGLPRVTAVENSIEGMQQARLYATAGTPFMFDEDYFNVGSIQGSGNGAPNTDSTCCYSVPIPYVAGNITITATAAAQELIRGVRIQVRNDKDFSTTSWRLVQLSYSFPENSVALPSGYSYVTFGFNTLNSARWDYSMMEGITITTDADWSVTMSDLASHIYDLENPEDSIIDRNDSPETMNILQQWSAKPKQGRTSTYADVSPLVMLHFSDVHGDSGSVRRIVDFKNNYSTYITDVIHTGDAHYNSWSDGFTLWDIDGAGNFLNTIGNHDTASTDGSTYDWDAHVGLDAYNRFFAPYISGWGVTQPTDAATNGYCYYYKDYSSCGIRLVVLDEMGWDSTQQTWFEDVVSSTITAGYGLVVAKHYPISTSNFIASGWTSLIDQRAGALGGGTHDSTLTSIIDDFKDNNGNFICWINGHTHRDMFSMVGTNNNQLCVNIGSATNKQAWWDESLKVADSKSEDLFNVISFDSYLKIVKVYRVGNDYNYYGQHRGTITIDYTSGKVLNETSSMENQYPSGDPMHKAYVNIGATWNDSTGYWEMNGLTDITNDQMLEIYNASMQGAGKNAPYIAGEYFGITARTIFKPSESGVIAQKTSSGFEVFFNSSSLEVLHVQTANTTVRRFESGQMVYTFANCRSLKYIYGILDVSSVTSYNNVFLQCSSLETVFLKGLKASVSLSNSPNLTTDSILYMINNEGASSAITITLHATAYTAAMANSDIVSALETHTNVTLASA